MDGGPISLLKHLPFLLMQSILTAHRNRIIARHLPAGAVRIADFGCGHFPNRYANVLVDSLRTDDIQRGGLEVTVHDKRRIFHDIDLNRFPYPFEDQSFDYLICSHVLEHLNDPVQTCREFSRIAKAGYVEVPFAGVDSFIRNNDAIHIWLCGKAEDTGVLQFIDRRAYLAALPPRPLGLALRFLLQLHNLAIPWDGELRAAYLQFEPTRET